MKIKYDLKLMSLMSVFNSISKAKLKDCFVDARDILVFVVDDGELGKAIGKNGSTAKLISKRLNRKIRIVEYNDDVTKFTENAIYPQKAREITEENGVIQITPIDNNTRGLLIGRNATNLRGTESIIKRYFEITEVRVLNNGKEINRN